MKFTFTKVAIERVRIKRWWTDAFARLHALLVSFALVVTCASLLGRRTETVVRVSTISMWTDALMGTRQIDTLRSVSANLMPNDALVDICESMSIKQKTNDTRRLILR